MLILNHFLRAMGRESCPEIGEVVNTIADDWSFSASNWTKHRSFLTFSFSFYYSFVATHVYVIFALYIRIIQYYREITSVAHDKTIRRNTHLSRNSIRANFVDNKCRLRRWWKLPLSWHTCGTGILLDRRISSRKPDATPRDQQTLTSRTISFSFRCLFLLCVWNVK